MAELAMAAQEDRARGVRAQMERPREWLDGTAS